MSFKGDPTWRLVRTLGLDWSLVEPAFLNRRLFPFLLLGQPHLVELQCQLQQELLKRLKEVETRLLLRQLWSQSLRLWSLTRLPDGRTQIRAQLEPVAEEVLLDDALWPSGAELGEHPWVLGWLLQWSGKLWLIVCDVTDLDGVKALEAVRQFPLELDRGAFWAGLCSSVLTLGLEEDLLLRRRHQAEFMEINPGEGITITSTQDSHYALELVVRLMGMGFRGVWLSHYRIEREHYPRESFATAQEPQRRRLMKELVRLRQLVGGAMRSEEELEAWLPLSRMLAGFAMDAQGQPLFVDRQSLRHQSLSLLLLPDDHMLFARVHPNQSIHDGLKALADEPKMLAQLEAAFETWYREEVWLSCFEVVDLAIADHIKRLDIDEILHAFRELFSPRFGEVKLALLDLERASLRRLERALAKELGLSDEELEVGVGDERPAPSSISAAIAQEHR